MNADLLAMLGGAGAVPGNAGGNNRRENQGKTILSVKAGKMEHVLQPSGKFKVTPNARRGEINLIWQVQPASGSSSSNNAGSSAGGGVSSSSGVLKFEWRDRRTRSTEHDATIFPEDNCTYSKVNTGREHDRVYLLQYANSDRRHFFWMQDKSAEHDEENAEKFQRFLCTPAACAAEAGAAEGEGASSASANVTSSGAGATSGAGSSLDLSGIAGQAGSSSALDNAALVQIMQGIGAGSGGSGASTGGDAAGQSTPSNNVATAAGGVDALSSILQNMGMPPPSQQQQQNAGGSTSAVGASAATPSSSGAGTGGTLTLADLQGAMAGLATSSPPPPAVSPPGPPLSEVASAAAVESSGILEDASVRQRLIELLPENQRTEEALMENIRSPQVQQALKSLSSALVGDAGTFNEVIANFQMNPGDGAAALSSGNPIQAFLDCLIASVEREKSSEKKPEGKEDAMEE